MGLTYLDAASTAFGRKAFTTAEFRHRVGALHAAKVLHDWKTRGMAARVAPGTYKLLGPEERPDTRAEEWNHARRLLLEAPLPMAWTGPTAVEVWTRGRYRTGTTPFRREFHIAVPRPHEEAWRAYLDAVGLPTKPKRSIGVKVVLTPVDEFSMEVFGGEPVIPRIDVVATIRGNPGLYAEAEALLDD